MRIFLSLLTVFVIGASTARASIMGNLIADGRLHGLQDTSADVGVTFNAGTGSYELSTGGLAAGDFLAAGIGFDTLERVGASDVPLTGAGAFSILKVRSVTPSPIGGGLASFVFDAPTVAEWGAIVDDLFGGLAGLKKSSEGTLVMVLDGAAQDFDRVAPPNTLAGSAASLLGSEIAELGFTGPVVGGNVQDNASGEGWIATGPTDPSVGAQFALNQGLPNTSFAFSLTRLEGFNGLVFDPLLSIFDGPGARAEFVGGGTLQGYGNGNGVPVGPWQIGNDADVSFRPLPEATSVMIWTILACASGSVVRRNRS